MQGRSRARIQKVDRGGVVGGGPDAQRGFDARLLRKARGVDDRSYVPSSSPRTNMPPWGDVMTRGKDD